MIEIKPKNIFLRKTIITAIKYALEIKLREKYEINYLNIKIIK